MSILPEVKRKRDSCQYHHDCNEEGFLLPLHFFNKIIEEMETDKKRISVLENLLANQSAN
jgi:hypothetical protein